MKDYLQLAKFGNKKILTHQWWRTIRRCIHRSTATWGHKVEKTESSNNQAQIVYNQIHQCLTEKGMNY